MSSQKKLKIKIFDKEYSLVVENEKRALAVSEYVNSLMNDLQNDMINQPPQTIAVVASLNIANDLFIEKEVTSQTFEDAFERLKKINTLLEDISN